MKAPFPYFGGKSRVAPLVWGRLGNVKNYIEPFCGSAAVLLNRPHTPDVETINDKFCMLANFWRAIKHSPVEVAENADWPVNETDMHARHLYLTNSDDAEKFRESIKSDPEYYDAKFAGWWAWGQSIWIGSGWCVSPHQRKRPGIGNSRGIHSESWKSRPSLSFPSGINGQMPNLSGTGGSGRGVVSGGLRDNRLDKLIKWFELLSDRLKNVRVCCGDWHRVCNSRSTTTLIGMTGVFLDPPYGEDAGRDNQIYAEESGSVAQDVNQWCAENGSNPKMRIILAGYEGEHNNLESMGWECVPWKAHGGYANRGGKNENKHKERMWFSPHCQSEGLFSNIQETKDE